MDDGNKVIQVHNVSVDEHQHKIPRRKSEVDPLRDIAVGIVPRTELLGRKEEKLVILNNVPGCHALPAMGS